MKAAVDDITTLVAVDAAHLRELKLVWPTWVCHRPQLLELPLTIIYDAAEPVDYWREQLAFVQHPRLSLFAWTMEGVSQREKMISSFVYAAAQLKTSWYLKLDTDAVAMNSGSWLDPQWFAPDETGRDPVFVSSPWSYSRPADIINQLDDWADQVPDLAGFPRLNLQPAPSAPRLHHPRIISWCFFGSTSAARDAVRYAPTRLPVPSQDTYLWYVAARRGDFFRKVRMSQFGWRHASRFRKLKQACLQAQQAEPASNSAQSETNRTAPASLPPSPSCNASAGNRLSRVLQTVLEPVRASTMRGAEIGVLRGDTSHGLLQAFPQLFLYMVDNWSVPAADSGYANSCDCAAHQHWAQHAANEQIAYTRTEFAAERRALLRANSDTASRAIADESLDFAFIDADHTYEGVSRDISAWWPKVRPGGILAGHDYGGRKNREGIWGVNRAVNEFAAKVDVPLQRAPRFVWHLKKPEPAQSNTFADNLERSKKKSLHPESGVIYLLTGRAHAARLVVSLWSLRQFYQGPVTVCTTRPESHEIGALCAQDSRLCVEHQQFPEPKVSRNSSFLAKLDLLPHAPYPFVTYLDADTLVVGPIDDLTRAQRDSEVVATQFSSWVSTGPKMRKRIGAWRNVTLDGAPPQWIQQLVDDALQPHPAINAGVFSVYCDSEFVRAWRDLTHAGKRTFICDEIAMQLLFHRYPNRLLDCRFNCSPVHASQTKDVRIWHFHGERHLRNSVARKLWLNAYENCLQENIAGLREWTPGGDPELAKELARGAPLS